jgi:hypothetical protein
MGERVREAANCAYRTVMDKTAPPLLGTARDWAIDLAVATVIGLFFGLVGPFGSFLNGSPAVRIAHWVLSTWSAVLIFGLVARLGLAAAQRWRIPAVVTLGAGLLIGAVPLAVLVALIARSFWPDLSGMTALDWYGQCLIISTPSLAAYVGVRWILTRDQGQAAVSILEPVPLVGGTLDEVLCLRMEDHYVRIHSAVGSRLVAGPFERVIASLGECEGMRVHRSWWVARSAVVGVRADGRNLKLELSNGLQAPVSRASVARLRQVGWLPSQPSRQNAAMALRCPPAGRSAARVAGLQNR